MATISNLRSDDSSRHICSIDGCGRTHQAKGLCGGHYQRKRSGLSINGPLLTKHESLSIGWKFSSEQKKAGNTLCCPVCGGYFARTGTRKDSGVLGSCCSRKCKAVFHKGRKVRHGMGNPKKGSSKICKMCGQSFYRPPSHNAIYCSRQCRDSDPTFHNPIRGSNNYNWKGGVTPQNQKDRRSRKYRAWQICIMKKFNYSCFACGYRGRHMRAHHILAWAEYPEHRFNINNGVALCAWCHEHIHHGE